MSHVDHMGTVNGLGWSSVMEGNRQETPWSYQLNDAKKNEPMYQ